MNILSRVWLLMLLALSAPGVMAAVTLPGPLVDSDWLARQGDQVVILDIRKDIKSFNQKPAYTKDKKTGKLKLKRVAGHIPGARLVNYKQVRSKQKIDGREVTRMLPSKQDFEKLMRSAGVNQNDVLIIVSKGEGNGDMTMATRLYWQLKYFGHDQLAILDGGMAQWLSEQRPVATRVPKIQAGNWQAGEERKEILATSEEVAEAIDKRSAQLVDTRMLSLYLGTWRKTSYVYADGHIPGAKAYPNELLTAPSAPARFTPTDELKALAGELGIDTDKKIITYCNSGHLASGSWFVMSELLGNKNVKLYDGSMHQWTLEKRPTVKLKME